MKKLKVIGIVLACITAVILAGVGVYYLMGEKIHIEPGAQAVLEFHDEGPGIQTHITQTLTEEESEQIRNILEGKWALPEKYYVNFTSEISVRFNDKYFCISRDARRIIRLNDEDLYIGIPSEKMDEIHQIFEKYGGYFPCV